ncbi:MAG: DUF4826 family protein [Planctomycetes bacterium]|nr:DUF4826 family protein [Planctomycetota bacterium]
MEEPDYDDPEVDEKWCQAAHAEVAEYLESEGLVHGGVSEWPTWYVAPIISVWPVRSLKNPASVGWWVIYGDIPTDYVSAANLKQPRDVLRAIAWRWKEYVDAVKGGAPPEDYSIGGEDPAPELLAMLESRAGLLVEMAADDEVWEGF